MRLIDADALIREECGSCDGHCNTFDGEECLKCTSHNKCQLREAIDAAPTVDAEPVRHSSWGSSQIVGYDGVHAIWAVPCKECGKYTTEHYKPYCPSCGAKMKRGKQDA